MPDQEQKAVNTPQLLNGRWLLLVEDEESIRTPLAEYLEAEGLRIQAAASAAQARTFLAEKRFDIIVLDIMMPGEDGLSLCRHIQETYQTPTLFLTARGEDVDRIVGLELGADDYLVKPFNPRELLARIKSVLRRAGGSHLLVKDGQQRSYRFANWTLYTDSRQLVDDAGNEQALSSGEYALLLAFVMRPHRVLSRETLLDLTRGREADSFDRSIDNMISRLRRKIEPDSKSPTYIKTIWGGGYAFQQDVRVQ